MTTKTAAIAASITVVVAPIVIIRKKSSARKAQQAAFAETVASVNYMMNKLENTSDVTYVS
jgi:hypothetical protein